MFKIIAIPMFRNTQYYCRLLVWEKEVAIASVCCDPGEKPSPGKMIDALMRQLQNNLYCGNISFDIQD